MKSILKSIVVKILTIEARIALARHKPRIVAVTGNVGKTSTKDAIDAVLSHVYGVDKVRKSQKSMNSEIGLPLAILNLDTAWSSAQGWTSNIWRGLGIALFSRRFPSWLVLEIGADHPGDIESVAEWLCPDIVVLTRMSDIPVHVEFFADAAAVLREKIFLANALKVGGTLVVNADDAYFMEAVQSINAKRVLYGKAKGSHVEIIESEIDYDGGTLPLPTGQRAKLKISGNEASVRLLGALGEHLVYPIASAYAVAHALGILPGVIEKAFDHFESPKGRMRILPGVNSSALIDDTYNASPLAATEALVTMGRLTLKGKKIAALADMKELGANTEKAHYDIGKLAGETLHTLATVGPAARFMVQGALDAGLSPDRILSFETSEEAGPVLRGLVRAGDAVLVKGSQSMRMERVSKALLANPETATDVLVRQEEEWGKR